MASLINQPDEEEFQTPNIPRQVQETPEMESAPTWFKAICAICWISVLVSVLGVFFITPAFSATETENQDVLETEQEQPTEELVESEDVASQVASATAAISNNLSAEEAETISNDAYELAQKVAEAQANARTNMYDEEAYNSWIETLQKLLPESPNQAVVWYTPANDVEFSWDTFQPYIFEADKVSSAEPAVRVLWLARQADGTVLSWTTASYDANTGTLVDFERGVTSNGYALMPRNTEGGETSDDVMLSDMQGMIAGLQDLDPVLPDEQETTEENKAASRDIRGMMRDRRGVTFE